MQSLPPDEEPPEKSGSKPRGFTFWNRLKKMAHEEIAPVYYITGVCTFVVGGAVFLWNKRAWFAPVFNDSQVTYPAAVIVLCTAILVYITMCYRASKQREKSYKKGLGAGKEDGYALGQIAGLEQGQKEGIEKGKHQGFRLGHEQGLEEGLAQGAKQEQIRSDTELLKPLREALIPLCEKLNQGKLEDEIPKTIEAYANLIRTWNGLVVNAETKTKQAPIEEWRLATHVLRSYLTKLADQKHPLTERLFLPATFELYALCVSDILKTITEDLAAKNKNGTVRIWTHLRQPLERWYNIAEGQGKNGRYAHTYKWWEDYKKAVRDLRRSSSGKSHIVQMRRLVSLAAQRKKTTSAADLAKGLYLRNSVTTIPSAIRDSHLTSNGNIRLLDEIDNALKQNGQHLSFPIHIIGESDDSSSALKPHWIPLRRHFEEEFHDGTYPPMTVAAGVKGVYCAYENQPIEPWLYEDVFLVDMDEINAGLFGIAFYKDPVDDLNGIVFLTDSQIAEEMQRFEARWKNALPNEPM